MKKLFALLVVTVLIFSFAFAEEVGFTLSSVNGTYTELFPEFSKDDYRSTWVDYAKTLMNVDEETAGAAVDMLLGTYMSDIYGQEAIDTYGDGSQGIGFDCYFLHDVAQITVDGNTISGVDADGNELFSHTYTYVGDEDIDYFGQPIGAVLHVFQSNDPDSGDFTYFAFADDTPDATYHIEFRYGDTEENIANYTEGVYAYWLAAGIPADYSEELMLNCIDLFATENLSAQ